MAGHDEGDGVGDLMLRAPADGRIRWRTSRQSHTWKDSASGAAAAEIGAAWVVLDMEKMTGAVTYGDVPGVACHEACETRILGALNSLKRCGW